jgi:hypothetical protein
MSVAQKTNLIAQGGTFDARRVTSIAERVTSVVQMATAMHVLLKIGENLAMVYRVIVIEG